MDPNLSGLIVGLTLHTPPESIYRALIAATAAGHDDSVAEAAEKMGDKQTAAYTPDADASARYDLLYEQYLALHAHFGRGGSDVMHVLRKLQREARGN